MNVNNMNRSALIAGILASALAGCGASSTPMTATQANLTSNVLQFAVGTANLYGTATGVNVVATYRQPTGAFAPGASGALVDSPVLTFPAPLPAALSAGATAASYDACATVLSAPAPGETHATSSSQTPGTTTLTSFGQSGGVFGIGIEPFNAAGQASCTPAAIRATGTPAQVAPYPVPLYGNASPSFVAGTGDPNAFVAWGGPPAFILANSGGVSPVGNGNYPAGTAGVSEGLDIFAGVAPVAGGTYGLSVSIPANNGTVTQAATPFTMPPAVTVLGAATAPAYAPDAAGDGGGTFAFVMPALATQAYLQVTDFGPIQDPAVSPTASCNGSDASPVYYTFEVTASGSVTLPAAIGPGGAPSVCTAAQNSIANATAEGADQIAVQVIGFDYDVYHASYPLSLGVPNPTILGARGSDDVTVSAAICQVGAASCTASLPLLRRRAATIHRR